MRDGTANGGGMYGSFTGSNSGDDVNFDLNGDADPTRLHRRAVFLSELENARRMIARAREVDRSLVVRELIGRRSTLRGR